VEVSPRPRLALHLPQVEAGRDERVCRPASGPEARPRAVPEALVVDP
jgi:hypothetical protein